MVTFCFDRIEDDRGYPNLAPHDVDTADLDHTWPRVTSMRLLMYMDWLDIKYQSVSVNHDFAFAWYPIALSWFDHDLDYFALLPDLVKTKIKSGHVKILFFYHEGDNPTRISLRLSSLCANHGLSSRHYIFVGANSQCDRIDNFYYFPDHEVFFNFVNKNQSAPEATRARSKMFTILSRTHKSWRASCMSDLHREGLLENSLWSYHIEKHEPGDLDPFDYQSDPSWTKHRTEFLKNAPYRCDQSTSAQQNNHAIVNAKLYTDSFCHIVIETFYDVDQSNGVFLTEKTFKCIKYGQPFVIVGPANSLSALREKGYRTFDHVIDNRYDTMQNNVQRWHYLKHAIRLIQQHHDINDWFLRCQDDIFHNQLILKNRSHYSINRLLSNIS